MERPRPAYLVIVGIVFPATSLVLVRKTSLSAGFSVTKYDDVNGTLQVSDVFGAATSAQTKESP
jgi:hypothetical protein